MKLSEAIYNGLTNLGTSYERSRIVKQNHELESIKLGLIDDSVKLKMLKRKLYNDAMDGKETEELRKNIELIIKELKSEDKSEAAIYNGLFSFFGNVFSTVALVGCLYIFGASTITICSNNRESQYCNNAKNVIEYFVGNIEDENLLPYNTDKK